MSLTKITLKAPLSSFTNCEMTLTEAQFTAAMWAELDNGGGNIRLWADINKTTRLPIHVKYCDTVAEETNIYFLMPNVTTAARDVYLEITGTGDTQPAVDAAFGQHAVYSPEWAFRSHDGFNEDTDGNATFTGQAFANLIDESPLGFFGASFNKSGTDNIDLTITALFEYTLTANIWNRQRNSDGCDLMLMQDPVVASNGQSGMLYDTNDSNGNEDLGLFNTADGWLRSGYTPPDAVWVRHTKTGSAIAGLRTLIVNGIQRAQGVLSPEGSNRTLFRVGNRSPSTLAWQTDAVYANIGLRKRAISVEQEAYEYDMQYNNATFFEVNDAPVPATIDYSLFGGATETTVMLNGHMSRDSDTIRVEYADNVGFTNSSLSNLIDIDPTDFLFSTTLTGLTPDTPYFYRYVDDGVVVLDTIGQNNVFECFTVLVDKPYSYKYAAGGCHRPEAGTTQSFARLLAKGVKMYFALGDNGYSDTNNVAAHKAYHIAYYSRPEVRAFFDEVMIVFMYDDHDGGLDNWYGDIHPTKLEIADNFRRMMPHYPYELGAGSIYHSFTIGQVRHVVPDLRYERGDLASEVMISTTQMSWLLADLTAVSNNANLKAVNIHNSVQWTDNSRTETWHRAPAQRTQITDHLVSLGLDSKTITTSSNLHAGGGDDGTNNIYGTGGTGGFPHYCLSPILATSTTELPDNGEYNLGLFGTSNGGSLEQHGTIDVAYDSSILSLTTSLYNSTTNAELFSHEFTPSDQITNTLPESTDPADQNLAAGEAFSVSFTLSDADNDAMTYTIQDVNGHGVALTDTRVGDVVTVTGTAPTAATSSIIRIGLTPSDTTGAGTQVTVDLNVAAEVTNNNTSPVITSFTPNQTVARNTPVTLTAVATDADGDSFTYTFRLVSGGVALTPSGNQVSFTTLDNDSSQTIVIGVTANDGQANSIEAFSTVSVIGDSGEVTLTKSAEFTLPEEMIDRANVSYHVVQLGGTAQFTSGILDTSSNKVEINMDGSDAIHGQSLMLYASDLNEINDGTAYVMAAKSKAVVGVA